MDAVTRIERTLGLALEEGGGPACPPRLAAAVRHAVFPRGSRIRPRLCLAVAAACGDLHPAATDCAAAAIELLHCASLVHDDLPCFDDAATRRGRPTVHAAFGQPLAVLAGDALIVLAFETLARGTARLPRLLPPLMLAIGRASGMPYGISAGQAWESEPQIDLSLYHRAKTGALFVAAAVAAAIVNGADPARWAVFGDRLGEAYQVADDLRDAVGDAEALGKPVDRDAALGRPSAVTQFGLAGAVGRLEGLVVGAIEAIPPCAGAGDLRALIAAEAQRLLPKELARRAA
jgi:geranylgeranyl diphosphate synthase type II